MRKWKEGTVDSNPKFNIIKGINMHKLRNYSFQAAI